MGDRHQRQSERLEQAGLHIGVSRTKITPPAGVELAGLGYYLERVWQRVRDDLTATAFVAEAAGGAVAIAAVDLMYMDAAFTSAVREAVAKETNLPPEAICVTASHSHNAPTAGFIRGAGESNLPYLRWAEREVAAAIIRAWQNRRPATLRFGRTHLEGWTFNRTRPRGPVDTQVGVLRCDDTSGQPMALVINFAAHPTIMLELGAADVSRDYPGQLVDLVEQRYPGAAAMFVQGACGDINFERRWQEPDVCREPGQALAAQAVEAIEAAEPLEGGPVSACCRRVLLPTRRYSRDEVLRELDEGRHRLATGDVAGWRETLGRVMVNVPDRFPERYGGDVGRAVKALARFAVEWTEEVLEDLDTRPETVAAEVQALRIGDVFLAAQPAELFSGFALELRERWGRDKLLIAGYANGNIGYMPDAHDIERRSYAATQSPKCTGQFPFTPASGGVLVDAMLEALEAQRR